MALILNIDSTTKTCSVSVTQNGSLASLRESHDSEYKHAENLNIYISEAMKESGHALSELDAISVARGPGSYTGLRIGVSSAKGLCFALDKPLISVCPLKALALQFIQTGAQRAEHKFLVAPMIDARRDEVFMMLFNADLQTVEPVSAEIITPDFFKKWPEYHIYLAGDGAAKFSAWFADDPQVRVTSILPSAKYNGWLAEENFALGVFEDVAYFEPTYGKEFQTTVSRKKL